MRRVRCRGFTITQLLVVIGIIFLLIAFLLPTLMSARQHNRRVQCASNLKQIGLAMLMYSDAEKNGGYPCTYFDESDGGSGGLNLTDAGFVDRGTTPVNSFSNTNTPSRANLPANSIGGSFYLLLKTQDLTPAIFICPQSFGNPGFQTFPVQNSNNFGGWGPASATNAGGETIPDVTYSYCDPFPSQKQKELWRAYKWDVYPESTSEFALVADANPGVQTINGVTGSPATVEPTDPQDAGPGGTGQAFGNSINHQNRGQNVLYGDGHVEFQRTCWCGSYRYRSLDGSWARDNIFTNGTQETAGGSFGTTAVPQDLFDSVLLPTSN